MNRCSTIKSVVQQGLALGSVRIIHITYFITRLTIIILFTDETVLLTFNPHIESKKLLNT